jgi:hypothetical protein
MLPGPGTEACGEAAARWEKTQTVTNGMESHRSAIIDRRKKAIKNYSYSLK